MGMDSTLHIISVNKNDEQTDNQFDCPVVLLRRTRSVIFRLIGKGFMQNGNNLHHGSALSDAVSIMVRKMLA
jgi:hypothetical protein